MRTIDPLFRLLLLACVPLLSSCYEIQATRCMNQGDDLDIEVIQERRGVSFDWEIPEFDRVLELSVLEPQGSSIGGGIIWIVFTDYPIHPPVQYGIDPDTGEPDPLADQLLVGKTYLFEAIFHCIGGTFPGSKAEFIYEGRDRRQE